MTRKVLFAAWVFPLLAGILSPALSSARGTDTGESADMESPFLPNPIMILRLESQARNPVRLDGRIEENEWAGGSSFGHFTEYQPNENRKPAVETEGYVVMDSSNLLIAFVCHDPEIRNLRANFADRDKMYEDDWVCVSIDPDRDFQKAYQFFVNPRGIQGDMLFQASGLQDQSFDMVWESESQILDDRWTAELRIPFESLRFPSSDLQRWTVHFTRNYPRDNPYRYSWMPITQNNNSFMGQGGHLEFTIPTRKSFKRSLEFLPYMIGHGGKMRNEDPESPNPGAWSNPTREGRMGFGLKLGLASNVTADMAVSPDFSQIETDAGQISLNNPFALFFEEKRPFFQEGSETYTVDQFTPWIVLDQYVQLFYSRTINDPISAGKLSAKRGKWRLGYTAAMDRNTPYILPFEENSSVLATDKKSVSNIMSLKMDLGNQSSIGWFMSDRRLQGPGSNTVAAFHGNFRLGEKYTVSGIAAYARTREPDDSLLSQFIRPQAFEARGKILSAAFDGESFGGTLLRAKVQRDSRHLSAAAAYQDFSPGFRAENGFLITNGYRNIEIMTRYAFRYENHPLFTSIEPRVNTWRKFDYDRIVKDTGVIASTLFRFRSQTILSLSGFIFNRENLRGKQFGDARQMWIVIQSQMFKTVSWNSLVNFGKHINRMGVQGDARNPFEILPTFSANAGITWKPLPSLIGDLQYQEYHLWLEDFGSAPILEQRILRNTLSVQFNRNLFIRLIGEYNIMDYYRSSDGRMIHDQFLTLDPLISYKLNAFSVFYLGGRIGAKKGFLPGWTDIQMNEQAVYMKFQYLFQY